MNTYWTEFVYTYECFNENNKQWTKKSDIYSTYFHCRKSELIDNIKSYVQKNLLPPNIIVRNIEVSIYDKYITNKPIQW